MPPWTPMETTNIASHPIIPSIPNMSRVPPNHFNPFLFGLTHILQLIPLIRSGYIPSTSHPKYSMMAQSGHGSFGVILPQRGGYNLNQYFNPCNINIPRGNATRVGPSVYPMSSN